MHIITISDSILFDAPNDKVRLGLIFSLPLSKKKNCTPPLTAYAVSQANRFLITRLVQVASLREVLQLSLFFSSSCPAWTSTRNIRKCGFDSLNRDGPNPHTLYGAMVGGPNERGEYTDDRSDYISNEVAIDYNAGFQGAVAGKCDVAF